MKKKQFTIKVFKRRGKRYIGVWKKGRSGFFSIFRYNKKDNITVKQLTNVADIKRQDETQIRQDLGNLSREQQKKNLIKYLYRFTYTKHFKYDDNNLGQLRIEAFGLVKNAYPLRRMSQYWKLAFRILWKTDENFKKMYQRYKVYDSQGAYESRIINKSEMRGRTALNVYADFIGFGMKTTKSFIVSRHDKMIVTPKFRSLSWFLHKEKV